MNHVMIDIETLGKKSYSVIRSIGAVFFDPTERTVSHQSIEIPVCPVDCQKHGLQIDSETVFWWLKQSDEARKTMIESEGVSLNMALTILYNFIRDNATDFNDVRIWGNSPRFDMGILQNAFDKLGMPLPWQHYNELDVRTIKWLWPQAKGLTDFKGIKHHPVDDCKFQLEYLFKVFDKIEVNEAFIEMLTDKLYVGLKTQRFNDKDVNHIDPLAKERIKGILTYDLKAAGHEIVS